MDGLAVICFLLSLCHSLNSLNLPPNFKKCDRKNIDFNQCLPIAVEGAIRQMVKPFKKYGLPKLEPAEIQTIIITAQGGVMDFVQNYSSWRILHHTNVNVKKFIMNFETNTIFMECFFPKIKHEVDYSFNGTIMAIPIYGSGPGMGTFENATYILTFKLEEYVKKGKEYYRVVDTNLVIQPEKIGDILFKGLFDGDKILEDRVNRLINDNWDLLWAQAKTSYETILAKYFAAIFNSLLYRVTIAELFGDKE